MVKEVPLISPILAEEVRALLRGKKYLLLKSNDSNSTFFFHVIDATFLKIFSVISLFLTFSDLSVKQVKLRHQRTHTLVFQDLTNN